MVTTDILTVLHLSAGHEPQPGVPTGALCSCSIKGARILGIFPSPFVSHQLPFQALMKALAARGHQITVISPQPLKVFCL